MSLQDSEAGTNSAKDVDRPLWIHENIERISQNLEEVELLFGTLSERLVSVMSPSTPTLANDDTSDKMANSPIAAKLDHISQRLAEIAYKQQSLLSRLEI